MKEVNLLPKSEIKELQLELVSSQVMSFFIWVLVSLGVVFVLSIAATILLNQRINSINADVEAKKQTLRTSATQQLEAEVTALNKRIALIERLKREHYYWSNPYLELISLLDTDTHFTTVQMSRETGEVVVNGVAADRGSVLAFWAAVKKSQYFENINFPLTNLERDVDANFTYKFYLKPEEMKKE